MTLYQDTDGKLFDDAIQRQIQLHQQNGLLSPQNATMMFGLWYKERNQVLADFRARVGSNYNASNVEGAAFDYVRSRAMSMNPYQTMAGGYPPPMPNYGAPMNYQNQWTPGYDVSRLQQSMTGMPINFNSTQQSNLNMRVSTTQVRKVTATVEPQPVTEQNDINVASSLVYTQMFYAIGRKRMSSNMALKSPQDSLLMFRMFLYSIYRENTRKSLLRLK